MVHSEYHPQCKWRNERVLRITYFFLYIIEDCQKDVPHQERSGFYIANYIPTQPVQSNLSMTQAQRLFWAENE